MLSLQKVLISTIIVLGAAVIGVGVYLFLSNDAGDVTSEVPEAQYVEREELTEVSLYDEMLTSMNQSEELGGWIFITSGMKAKPATGSFAYEIAADNFEYLPTSTDDLYFHLHKSEEAERYIFKGQFTEQVGEEWYNPGLFTQDENGRNTVALGEAQDGDMLYRVVTPRLSPDGTHFVYSSKSWEVTEEEPNDDSIWAWDIYLGEANSVQPTTFIADGYGAQWSADGQWIFYVKEDGVYVRRFVAGEDVATAKEHLLISDLNVYGPQNKFDISRDEQYLVLSQPVHPDYGNPHVDIYKLDLASTTPAAQQVHRLIIPDDGGAYWPMFSPEGRYISMQTRDFLPDGTEDNNIRFYDLVTQTFTHEVNFNDADFDAAFNTDWITEFDTSSLAN